MPLIHYFEPFQAYLQDDTLTEIAINRPGEIWTEGINGWTRYDAPFITYDSCMALAKLISNDSGKWINKGNPILSTSLATKERVQLILPPCCEQNTVSITIRKPSIIDKTLDELDNEGAFNLVSDVRANRISDLEVRLLELKEKGHIKEFLDEAVLHKRNILISGKTGSGKTTITKSLIRSIPLNERLITIEDVHELFLNQHENKVHLFYSREDEAGENKISCKSALASCLRMKPDRILLAELRGDEAWEFIKAINTGHPGSISTMHANGALESFEQLTAFIKDSQTGAHLDADYIKSRLFSTIDIVLFYDRRKLLEIYYDPQKKLDYLSKSFI